MSQENVDLVRSVFGAWERDDYSSVDWVHPEIEFAIVDGPSPGTWTGLPGMVEGYREVMNAWEDYSGAAEGYREPEREQVLVLIRLGGRGKASGLELGQVQPNAAGIFHVRDGKISKVALYWDRDRAFADISLPE